MVSNNKDFINVFLLILFYKNNDDGTVNPYCFFQNSIITFPLAYNTDHYILVKECM